MVLDLFVLLIVILFFVIVILVGIYFYCCYFRISKEENDLEKFVDKVCYNLYEDGSSVGVLIINFYNYFYFLLMMFFVKIYDVDVGFLSFLLNKMLVIFEKNVCVFISFFEDRDLMEFLYVVVCD